VAHHQKADQDLKDQDLKADRHLKAGDLVDSNLTQSDSSIAQCNLIAMGMANSAETN